MPETKNNLLEELPETKRHRLRKRKQPSWTTPMLATLTDERFSDDDWIFERKLDGERCLAFVHGDRVTLLSRNKKHLNAAYPEIVRVLEQQARHDYILDGEIVAFDGPVTSFSRLQQRMQIKDRDEATASNIAVYYYVFDLLYLDGHDTTHVELRDRKKLLRDVLSFDDPLRFTTHRNAEGEAFYREACRKGWEGVIAKRADSPYRHTRSRDWLKFKCVSRQEFVIGGYTDPHGERIGFGALLIGYYDNGRLVYAGKVGTGYDEKTLKDLRKRLSKDEMKNPSFKDGDLPSRGVHWVKPTLVAQIGFTEWTDDGRLRHPRFLGLRRDKKPRQVHRETAE